MIHEWVWAGTPNEGAAWFCLQRLADTWHRILLVPVTGGVIVGMRHGLLEILDQIKQSISSEEQGFDLLAGIFPTVKAIQASITFGTGCSLGPEGPSVDIEKSCAHGCSVMMENNNERRIALVAAGEATGIASGFNAAVAGCFFAIETVLRPLRAENSPPFTTAMIILASVISSTVSNAVLGEKQAFTVPTYNMKSAVLVFDKFIVGKVGMAATLASVCSVPLTSVLLLFELTKDYRILLPLMGAVGLAIWVPSVTNESKEGEASDTKIVSRGYSVISPVDDKNEVGTWCLGDGDGLELSIVGNGGNHDLVEEDASLENLKVSHAMTMLYVKVSLTLTLREALKCMHDGQQNCALVVDAVDHLEGILTVGDIKRCLSKNHSDASSSVSSVPDVRESLVSSICTRGISYCVQKRGLLTCYPDTDLATVKQLNGSQGNKAVACGQARSRFQRRKFELEEDMDPRKSIDGRRKEDSSEQKILNNHE